MVTERIFDGLKVIDCASFIAGPAAATIMSDFGAEVVKIEPPGMGDPYRRRAVPDPKNPLNPGFLFDTRNKRSLALDLRTATGRAVLYRLVKEADAFITNYPPPARGPPRHEALSALRAHYQCRDGRWLLLSIAADEWRWEKFKTCFNAPELENERFATNASRDKHARELVTILDKLFAEHDLAHWRKKL